MGFIDLRYISNNFIGYHRVLGQSLTLKNSNIDSMASNYDILNARPTDTQLRHKSKKSENLGRSMWQTKYASAVPKNLGVGVDFRP